jgi:hypothetical protein
MESMLLPALALLALVALVVVAAGKATGLSRRRDGRTSRRDPRWRPRRPVLLGVRRRRVRTTLVVPSRHR